MVALAVLMPVMLFVSWSLRLEAPLPEPANTALMLLDPVLGVAALVLLPRVLYRDGGAPGFTVDPVRERRALVFGVGVVLCSGIAGSAILPGIAAVVSLAGRRRVPWVVAAAASFFGSLLLSVLTSPDTPTLGLGRWELALVAPWMAAVPILLGIYLGGRRELLRSLRREAEAANRGREEREARARQEERTEIAREMHDTVSHLSLIHI